jgi:hypothetical protein
MKLTKTDERSNDRLMVDAIMVTNDLMLSSVLMELVDDINELVPDEDWSTAKELFPLARVARTVEKKLQRKLKVADLEAIFNLWAKCIESADYTPHIDLDCYYITFVAVFESTKVPHDEGGWEQAFMLAMDERTAPGFSALPRSNEDLRTLASLCFHLQQVALHNGERGNSFPLSVRKANEVLPHLSIQTISNKMRYLQAYGIIKEVKKGTLEGRRASYFKYTGKEE